MKNNKRKSDFRWRKEITLLPSYIIGVIWAFFTIFMIGWIIAASLSSTKEVFTGNVLSTGLHFENYTKAFFRNKALMNLLNSVIYTVPSCILTIIVSAPAEKSVVFAKCTGFSAMTPLIVCAEVLVIHSNRTKLNNLMS